MKKLLIAVSLFFASFSAFAGLQQSFMSTDNKSFTLNNVREVNFTQGSVSLTFTDGSQSYQYLQDKDGSVAKRIKASSAFYSFIQVGTEDRYIDPKYARYVICQQGGTNVAWAGLGAQFFPDNCQLFERIKASGN